jgi:hypothetical protein
VVHALLRRTGVADQRSQYPSRGLRPPQMSTQSTPDEYSEHPM